MTDRRAVPPSSVWLHVGGLWAVAVAQPLLDLTGASPEFFVTHRADGIDILLLVLALTIVMPGMLAAGIWLAGRAGPRPRASVLYGVVGILAGVIALQAGVRTGAAAWPVAAAAGAAAAVGAGLAYHAWAAVRTFLAVLSVAVVVVPGLFLVKPAIRALTLGGASDVAVAPAPDRRAADRPPVVLVIFDELPLVSLLDRQHKIDAALYPHLAALADAGVWFRNATTVDDFTRYALPALVTGRYPSRVALPSSVDHPQSLFTLLASTHRLEVSEAVTVLCPPRLCAPRRPRSRPQRLVAMGRDLWIVFLHLVLTPDLTQRLPDPTATWAGFGGDDARTSPGADQSRGDDDDRALAGAVQNRWREGIEAARVAPVMQFIDGISRTDVQPTFYFLHTLISHQPHHMLPTGKQNRTSAALPGRRGWNRHHSWTVAQHYQRHLLQVGFVDELVGRLVTRLKSEGLYDRALVVITSDHGISYLPNAHQRDLTAPTAAEIMRVPLIIKFPKGRQVPAGAADANVESIDLLPTIADAIALDVPWPVDGTSLLDPDRPERRSKRMFSGDRRRRQDFEGSTPELTAPLERKLALFGDGSANRHRAPRLPPFDGLVGQSLAAIPVIEDGPAVEIADAGEFQQVDPAARAVPFDVSGRFAASLPDAFVAVAVNGTIEAVTRTWEANPRGWSATPRLDAWRRGANAVDVLLIERDAGGVRLRRAVQKSVRPADLNLISVAAADEWGVGQGGFHPVEGRAGGTQFRWTRARAELTNLVTHERPRAVEVVVMKVPDDAPKPLTIEANDCVIFSGTVGSGWSSTLPLTGCDLSRGDLTLRFTTAAVRSKADSRRRGVALTRVVLR